MVGSWETVALHHRHKQNVRNLVSEYESDVEYWQGRTEYWKGFYEEWRAHGKKLEQENAGLKAEIARLKAENDLLKSDMEIVGESARALSQAGNELSERGSSEHQVADENFRGRVVSKTFSALGHTIKRILRVRRPNLGDEEIRDEIIRIVDSRIPVKGS